MADYKSIELDKHPSLDEQLARAAEKVAQQNNTVSRSRRQREER